MRTAGLDDEKLSLLAKWAAGLRGDARAEVAAAGRAIELLIDEVERLNVLLWQGPLSSVPTAPEPVPGQAGADAEAEVLQPLRTRISAALKRARSDGVEAPPESTGFPQPRDNARE